MNYINHIQNSSKSWSIERLYIDIFHIDSAVPQLCPTDASPASKERHKLKQCNAGHPWMKTQTLNWMERFQHTHRTVCSAWNAPCTLARCGVSGKVLRTMAYTFTIDFLDIFCGAGWSFLQNAVGSTCKKPLVRGHLSMKQLINNTESHPQRAVKQAATRHGWAKACMKSSQAQQYTLHASSVVPDLLCL